jgi:hypothetical protein
MYSLRYTLFRLSFFTQLFFTAPTADAQTPSPWKKITDKPVTLDMKQGMISFHTPAFELKLLKSSQTVASVPLQRKRSTSAQVNCLKKGIVMAYIISAT